MFQFRKKAPPAPTDTPKDTKQPDSSDRGSADSPTAPAASGLFAKVLRGLSGQEKPEVRSTGGPTSQPVIKQEGRATAEAPPTAQTPHPPLSDPSVEIRSNGSGALQAPVPTPVPAVSLANAKPERAAEPFARTTEKEETKGWMARLRAGLRNTSSNLTGLFVGLKVDEALFEQLEDALLMADTGIEASTELIRELRQKAKRERIEDGQTLKLALADLLAALLRPLEGTLDLSRPAPIVMMIAGVNGAGKTTTIGKLALHFQTHGKTVLLAAGDTFRAAAREQLAIWGERNGVQVIAQESGDPAAVVFDSVAAGKARGVHIVMADTAGRLPTQLHLMEELKKIKRVTSKALDGAPHEVLLVLDGNTGQNAIAQVKAFDDAIGLTGLIVTKLDGTAKGGVLAAIVKARPVPVYFIGVGEAREDLQPFRADEFSRALLGL